MDVSRETLQRLEQFSELVLKWTKRINLVSSRSQKDLWDRHILDSLQLCGLAEAPNSWVDLGSGGGFPGVIAGIWAKDNGWPTAVSLIESDHRKSAFLRAANRELDLSMQVFCHRIEDVAPQRARVVSARALANLRDLLGFVERHIASDGVALLPKGKTWKLELEQAKEKWSFDVDVIQSVTQKEAVILKIKGLQSA